MATRSGARALGLAGEVGELSPGAWADLALHRCEADGAGGVLEELSAGRSAVEGVWIAGRPVRTERPAGARPTSDAQEPLDRLHSSVD